MAETTTTETKTDTVSALQAEITAAQEEKAELQAALEIYQQKNIEQAAQIASMQAELASVKSQLTVDSDSQSLVLKRIEKLNAQINEKEASVDTVPEGLTDEEVAAIRITRQDTITQLKQQKQNLRNLLGVN